jgi:hypothetical protein
MTTSALPTDPPAVMRHFNPFTRLVARVTAEGYRLAEENPSENDHLTSVKRETSV